MSGCSTSAAGTTFTAAEQVAPDGSVLGVDISPEMLAPARPRAAAVDNVELLAADAQVHPFPPGSFDAVISRFGTMFFEDPQAAFSNLHTALRPGGRMVSVCWQDPLESEWIAVSFGVAIPLVGRPPELGPPGAPGPFAFADGNRLRQLITAAGFGEVTLATATRPQCIGDDLDSAVEFIMSLPESRQLFESVPAGTVDAATAALRKALAPYTGPHGVVMDGTAWLVTAHR